MSMINNRDFALQINDFSNFRYGSIMPTDIDGLIEYKNKYWIIFEVKHEGSDMPFGQQLAIERLVDELGHKKPTIGIICTHNTTGDIDVASCPVYKYRYQKKWGFPKAIITTKELADRFINQ